MKGLRLAVALAAAAFIAARAARADETEEAKQHYQIGAADYERGDYASARTQFLAAWQLSHKPVILFDLARVETKLGNDERAIAYLEQYLKEAPDAVDAVSVRTEIEARQNALAERKKRAEAERQAEDVRKQAEAQRAADAARAEAAARRKRAQLRVAGWALLGGGLAVAAGGIACGIVAEHDASTVQQGGIAAGGMGTPPPFTGTASGAANEGALTQSLGIALDVVGGAIAATGIGLIVWTSRSARGAHAFVAPTGRGVVAAGSF